MTWTHLGIGRRAALGTLVGLLTVATLAAPPAQAQTRLSLDAGILVPFSNMSDLHGVSPLVGVRWEGQDVNALGRIATRTWFLRFGYGILQTASEVTDLTGDNSNGYYLDACIGGRAYAQSTKSPFFVSVSGGYAQYQGPGDSDTFYGGTVNGGLGLRLGLLGFVVEAEVRGHIAILVDTDNLEYMSGIVSLGIPL